MTEPNVASSDATNIQSSIVRDGDGYVINGRKWWTSGAGDPRCEILIFMGKTNPEAGRHSQQSMILVPMKTPGVKVLRTLTVFGYDHAPHGHAEVDFVNVRVPAENLLLARGAALKLRKAGWAQAEFITACAPSAWLNAPWNSCVNARKRASHSASGCRSRA